MLATQQQINEWKKKYQHLFEVTLLDEGQRERKCILRKPRNNFLRKTTQAHRENITEFNKIVVNACWLAGDEEIKTIETLFNQVLERLYEIIAFVAGSPANASLKKL